LRRKRIQDYGATITGGAQLCPCKNDIYSFWKQPLTLVWHYSKKLNSDRTRVGSLQAHLKAALRRAATRRHLERKPLLHDADTKQLESGAIGALSGSDIPHERNENAA
jgi:hypothetical protein